jgi:hypothetical protein
MGLLDEAIRDHLELKRRHGADPGEVERLEHEALGPARRRPAAAAVAREDAVYDVDEDFDDEVPADERLEDRDAAAEPRAPARTAEPEATPAREEPLPTVDQPTQELSLDELEEAGREPARSRGERPAGTEEGGDGEERSPDDVLEETPEFLSETPEHDRLWFEQKPPRDFEF